MLYPEAVVLYSNGSKQVLRRTSSGVWREVSHNPWFLISEPKVPRKYIDSVIHVKETDIEFYAFNDASWRYERIGKAHKVETKLPQNVVAIAKALERDGVKHSLSNVRYVARISLDLIDSVLGYRVPIPIYYTIDELEEILRDIYEKARKLRIAVIDIEVGNEGRFPQLGDPVILVGLGVGSLESEEPKIEILEGDNIHSVVDRVIKLGIDYLVGFNIHSFDLPYLLAYTGDQRIITSGQQQFIYDSGSSNIAPTLDLLKFAINYGSSLGLKSTVSRTLLQVAKDLGVASKEDGEIEKSIDKNHMMTEYRKRRDRVIKYLETDVRLTFRVAQKWLPILVILHTLTGISPYAQQFLPSMGSLAEYAFSEYLLKKHNIALEVRTRLYDYGEVEDAVIPYISRGHKVVAIEGVYRNVLQLDFDMLYPTIYYNDRVDPTSTVLGRGFLILLYSDDQWKKIKVRFCGGPLHEFFSYMYSARKVSKKIKSKLGIKEVDQAIKILANSSYGIFSKRRGIGVNEAVSAYIFYRANHVLNVAQRIVEQKYSRRVVYGDTDSLFIELREGDDPEKLAESINRDIKTILGESFNLKLENIHDVVAVYGKKNYVALSKNGEVVIKGIHRFSMPVAVKENLHEIVKQVLRGKEPVEVIRKVLLSAKTEDFFVSTVKRIEEFRSRNKFKESTHPSTRALLLSYLVLDVGIVPEQTNDFFTKQRSATIIIDESAVESGKVLSALWLKKQKSTICIFYSVKDGSNAELICGKFVGKPKVDEHHLEQNVIIWHETADREKLIEYALITCSTLIDILNTIYSMVKGARN